MPFFSLHLAAVEAFLNVYVFRPRSAIALPTTLPSASLRGPKAVAVIPNPNVIVALVSLCLSCLSSSARFLQPALSSSQKTSIDRRVLASAVGRSFLRIVVLSSFAFS